MPAQLKGWIDRVFSAGFAYGDANLAPRRAMITVTAETKGERFRSEGEAHPLHHIERGMLKFSGYTILPSFVVSDVYSIGAEERRERLKQLQDHVRIHFGQAASIAKAS
jgi:NAD(P)H dehydrogenase (quinone)